MTAKYVFTITDEMRRNPAVLGTNRQRLYEALGRIQRSDIGKRVYDTGNVLQVEHADQRKERLAKAKLDHAKGMEILANIDRLKELTRRKLDLLDELHAAITYDMKEPLDKDSKL